MVRIELVEGDVTAQAVDAIVNAANASLLGGGGVDGAIHRKGGPAILEECRALRAGEEERRAVTLRSCYTRSLAVADGLGATTLAFPLISSGAFGWPLEDAVRQALTALESAGTAVEEARLVLFGSEALVVAQRVAART